MTFTAHSLEETLRFGRLVGRLAPAGAVIALRGDLGAGKTALTRGIAEGAGVDDPSLVSSPTYVLLNIYEGPKPVYHVDAYRLGLGAAGEDGAEMLGTGESGLEYLLGGEVEGIAATAIVVVEWPERLPSLLRADRLEVQLDPGETQDSRVIHFHGQGAAGKRLATALECASR